MANIACHESFFARDSWNEDTTTIKVLKVLYIFHPHALLSWKLEKQLLKIAIQPDFHLKY